MTDARRINCNTAIEAAMLKDMLEEQGIDCQIWDETNSKVARGLIADQSVDVMVRAENYEKAFLIYTQQHREQAERTVCWCPRCGSENIQVTIQHKRFGNWTTLILGLGFLALGLFLIYENLDQNFFSWSEPMLLVIIGIGLLGYWVCASATNHKHVCRDCKHKF